MTTMLKSLLASDFQSFVKKAHNYLHGTEIKDEPYVAYLCHEAELFAKGENTRVVVNLPPAHLKTFIFSVSLSAWILGHNPRARIMLITHSDNLATEITYKVRRILRSKWFHEVFATRLEGDRKSVDNFQTTKGGHVYATSVFGDITGHRTDIIIIDDPLSIKSANNLTKIRRVNDIFNSEIVTRLNNRKTGRIIIVAHRLNEEDLSAHVLEEGWRRVALEMIASCSKSYATKHFTWERKKGEVLRADFMDNQEIKKIRQKIPRGRSRAALSAGSRRAVMGQGAPVKFPTL